LIEPTLAAAEAHNGQLFLQRCALARRTFRRRRPLDEFLKGL